MSDGVQWQNVHAVTGWFGIRIIRMLLFYCASQYVAGTWFQKVHHDESCWHVGFSEGMHQAPAVCFILMCWESSVCPCLASAGSWLDRDARRRPARAAQLQRTAGSAANVPRTGSRCDDPACCALRLKDTACSEDAAGQGGMHGAFASCIIWAESLICLGEAGCTAPLPFKCSIIQQQFDADVVSGCQHTGSKCLHCQ